MPKYSSSINRLLITPYSRDTCSSIIQLIPDILRIAKWTYTKENIQWARDAEYPYLSCFVFAHIVYVTKVFPKDVPWLSIFQVLSQWTCFHVSRFLRRFLRQNVQGRVEAHVRMRNDNMLVNLTHTNPSCFKVNKNNFYPHLIKS